MRGRLCVLGSGSGGNCSWVSLPGPGGGVEFLMDAGLSPRAVRTRLAARGLAGREPSLLLVTHADTDHFSPGWVAEVVRRRLPVAARAAHHAALSAAGVPRHLLLPLERVADHAPISLSWMSLPHDHLGSTAFRAECGGVSIGWATDLGCAGGGLLHLMEGVSCLGLESNYCPRMQEASARPLFLKERIMGGRGHLSNEQCLRAVTALLEGPGGAELPAPSRVVLLHLSRECNHPAVIESLWRAEAPRAWPRVTITAQDEPTEVLEFGPAGAEAAGASHSPEGPGASAAPIPAAR